MRSIEHLDTLDERMEIARRLLRTADPMGLIDSASALNSSNVNMLYGYVRSFVRLAYLGDVKKVADEIGITRQSVRNHVIELENLLEASLFDRVGATSKLTSIGTLWLPRAQEFFELAAVFLRSAGSNHAQYQSTQLPLRMLFNDPLNSALLRDFARSWMAGGNTLASKKFRDFRSYCIMYVRQGGAWVALEIGKKTAFSQWFGPDIAKQSQGKKLLDMETGTDLQDEVSFILDGVYTRGGLHFSEVACNLMKPGKSGRTPALYQRLLAEMTDDNGRAVIASAIDLIDPLQRDLVRD